MWRHGLLRSCWLVPTVLLCLPLLARAQAPDPVEDLRQALPIAPGDERNPLALLYRRQTLEKRAEALKTLSDLRRALALTEWKDYGSPKPVQVIDLEIRSNIAKRFQDGVEAIVKDGSTDSRLAVATMLREMGTSVRAVSDQDIAGFGRTMAPALIELMRDKDADVRTAAARALGQVNPVPKVAVDAFKEMLTKDGPQQRIAAAEGLWNLIQVIAQMQKKGSARTGIEASRKDVIDTAAEVIEGALAGLKDADSQVRRLALEALLQSATSFAESVQEPTRADLFPPLDRKLTDEDVKILRFAQEDLEREYKELEPLLSAFQGTGKVLAVVLGDQDVEVRKLSRRTLEMIGYARVRIRRRVNSVPVVIDGKLVRDNPLLKDDPLANALRPGVEAIAQRASDPNVAVRLAAVDFLETLLDGAVPALPVLASALDDPNKFVRWSAARTLGRLGPVETKLTLPGLVRVTNDDDTDLAIVAAATLERYGPAAKAAVPGLLQVIGDADQEVRLALFRTLASIGDAAAVPALTASLSDGEVRVRRGAAKALTVFGPEASTAVPALRQALRDDDAEVRQNASDALLSILRAGK